MIRSAQPSAPDAAPNGARFSRTPEQLEKMMKELSKNRFPIERLSSMAQAADARKELVGDFRKITGTNGDAERVMEELALYSRESNTGKKFLEKANTPEKKGLFRRGWEWMKSTAKKHPYITAAILLAVVGGAAYYTLGGAAAILARLHGLVGDRVMAQLGLLDAAPGVATPVMGPGMEAAGGGGSAAGMAEDFRKMIPLPSSELPPIPEMPPAA